MAITSAIKTRLGAYGGPRQLYGDFSKAEALSKGGGLTAGVDYARIKRLRLQQAILQDDEEVLALLLAENLIRRH